MSPLLVDLDVLVLHEPPVPIDPTGLSSLVEFALREAGATGRWSVAVVLTSDEHLRQLHREFMGIDEETDVMTFPNGHGDQGGDVIVSVERAIEQARDAGQSVKTEIEFLVVHGLLHLRGWDDDDADCRSRMLARQTEIIDAFRGTLGAFSGLCQPKK